MQYIPYSILNFLESFSISSDALFLFVVIIIKFIVLSLIPVKNIQIFKLYRVLKSLSTLYSTYHFLIFVITVITSEGIFINPIFHVLTVFIEIPVKEFIGTVILGLHFFVKECIPFFRVFTVIADCIVLIIKLLIKILTEFIIIVKAFRIVAFKTFFDNTSGDLWYWIFCIRLNILV